MLVGGEAHGLEVVRGLALPGGLLYLLIGKVVAGDVVAEISPRRSLGVMSRS